MRWRPSPRLGAALAAGPLGLLARTWRYEIRDGHHWAGLARRGDRFVFMLWHEMLLPLLWHHRHQGIAIVVSEARDGRSLAAFAARLGYQSLFGSSTRGGARALLQAVRTLAGGTPVAFTPDGPRGPRRELKPGVIHAAQRADARILPIVAVADREWRLGSWDRFLVPKPFARVRVGYGEPFGVASDPSGLDRGIEQAARVLHHLEMELQWRPDAAMATG